MDKFWAYGYVIRSEIELNAPLSSAEEEITIKKVPHIESTLEVSENDWIAGTETETRIVVRGLAEFLTRDGKEILAAYEESANEELVRSYLFGICFSFILQQRGVLPIHCSCVVKNGKTLMICGDSGAGKSTIASVFLNNGWKMMSDDIVPVINKDGKYFVQSSFPCRKMWQDAMESNHVTLPVIGELTRYQGRVKYQLDASSQFVDTCLPLDYCVMLKAGSDKLYTGEIQGFAKTDLLMRNRFVREHVPSNAVRQWQLSMCIGIASQIKAFLAERPYGEHTEQQIYEYIISEIEKDLGSNED